MVPAESPSVGVSGSCRSLAVQCQRWVATVSQTLGSVYRLVSRSQAYQHDYRQVLGSVAVRCQRPSPQQYNASGESLAVRCQRLIRVQGRRRVGPSSCWYRQQYGASGGSYAYQHKAYQIWRAVRYKHRVSITGISTINQLKGLSYITSLVVVLNQQL